MVLSLPNLEAGHLAAYGFQFNIVLLPGPSWACQINFPLTKRWDVLNHLGWHQDPKVPPPQNDLNYFRGPSQVLGNALRVAGVFLVLLHWET